MESPTTTDTDLSSLSRRDLQTLAKSMGIKANLKSTTIIKQIEDARKENVEHFSKTDASRGKTDSQKSSMMKQQAEGENRSIPVSFSWPTSFGSSTGGTAFDSGSNNGTIKPSNDNGAAPLFTSTTNFSWPSSFGSSTSGSAFDSGSSNSSSTGAASITATSVTTSSSMFAVSSSTPSFSFFPTASGAAQGTTATAGISTDFSGMSISATHPPEQGSSSSNSSGSNHSSAAPADEGNTVAGEDGERLVVEFRATLFRRSTPEEDAEQAAASEPPTAANPPTGPAPTGKAKGGGGGGGRWVEIGRGPMRLLVPDLEKQQQEGAAGEGGSDDEEERGNDNNDEDGSDTNKKEGQAPPPPPTGPRFVMRQGQEGGRGGRVVLNVGVRQQRVKAQRMGQRSVLLSFVEPGGGARSCLVQCTKDEQGKEHAAAFADWVISSHAEEE